MTTEDDADGFEIECADAELRDIFEDWLNALARTLQPKTDKLRMRAAYDDMVNAEELITATPATSAHGLVIKLAIALRFANKAGVVTDLLGSAYRDAVKLSGSDPFAQIATTAKSVRQKP
jgi:hypothetical protein